MYRNTWIGFISINFCRGFFSFLFPPLNLPCSWRFYSDFLWMSHSYGLGAAVISNDLERCDRVTKVRHELTSNLVQITHQNLLIGIVYLLRQYFSFAPVLQAFRAGIVWINCSQPCFCQAPWGGIKRSGFGRELGEWYDPNYTCQICKILFFRENCHANLGNAQLCSFVFPCFVEIILDGRQLIAS